MLQVRGLTVRKPTIEITNLDFQVDRGRALVFIGSNNSGKSAILERLADPDSNYQGTITLNHFNSREKSEHYKTQLGYLPQYFTPPLHLTGYEYLEMVGSMYYLAKEERSQRIGYLSKLFDADHELYLVMEHISPAFKQRIGLIASILAQAPLLIWDEPFYLLDDQSRSTAEVLLKERLDAGGSAVIATNDLALAEEIADYIIILDNGQIAAEGTLVELSHLAQSRKSLRDIYTKLLKL